MTLVPFATALHDGASVLDGGLSTELERAGHDVSSALWSARLLMDAPDAIVDAHAAYYAAGARVATTATYQATFEGFALAGLDRGRARELLVLAVRLARDAQQRVHADRAAWVAASAGPYGAMLADGSEYTGAYARPGWTGRTAGGLSQRELRAFHRPRLEVLAEAGADVLACETIPAGIEALALAEELRALAVPGWVSLSTVVDRHGVVRTRLGEAASPLFAALGEVDEVVAVGVNCTDPRDVSTTVAEAAAVSGKPVVAYPNSGETWDATLRSWSGPPAFASTDVTAWRDAGARLIGGCCRVGPDAIRAVAEVLA